MPCLSLTSRAQCYRTGGQPHTTPARAPGIPLRNGLALSRHSAQTLGPMGESNSPPAELADVPTRHGLVCDSMSLACPPLAAHAHATLLVGDQTR